MPASLSFAIKAVNDASAQLKAIQGDLGSVGGAAEKSGSQLGDLGESSKGLAGHMGTLALAAAGAVGAFASWQTLKAGIGIASELGGEVSKLKRETGLGAEEASKLIFAFDRFGVSGDEASNALGILAKKLQGVTDETTGAIGPGGKVVDVLKSLGIEAIGTDGALRPMGKLLPEISDVFKNMPAGPEKTALAMNLFGKSGKDLIPVLNKGSEGLKALGIDAEKFGLVLDDQSLGAIKKYKESQKDLTAALDGVKLQIGLFVMPILAKLTGVMVEGILVAKGYANDGIKIIREQLEKLQPVLQFAKDEMQAGADVVTGTLLPALESGADTLKNKLLPPLEDIASLLAGAFLSAATVVGDYITDSFLPALFDVAETVGTAFVDAVKKAADWLNDKLLPPLKDVASTLKDTLLPPLQAVTGFMKDNAAPATNAFGISLLGIVTAGVGASAGIGLITDSIGGLSSTISTVALLPNPVLLLAVALAAAAAAAYLLETKTHFLSETVLPKLKDLFGWFADHKEVTIAAFAGLVLPVLALTAAMLGLGSSAVAADVALAPVVVTAGLVSLPMLAAAAAIGAIIGGLVLLELKTGFLSEKLLPQLQEFGTIMLDLGQQVLTNWLLPAFANLIEDATDLYNALAPTLIPAFKELGKVLAEKVAPPLATVGQFLLDHKPILIAVAALVLLLVAPWLAVAAAIVIVLAKQDDIVAFFDDVTTRVQGFIDTITGLPVIGPIVQAAFDAVILIVEAFFETAKQTVQTQIDLVKGIFKLVLDLINGDFGQFKTDLLALVGTMFNDLLGLFDTQLDLIKGLVQTALTAWVGVLTDSVVLFLDAGRALLQAMLDGVSDLVTNKLLPFFTGLPQRVVDALVDFGSDLANVGVGAINMLIGVIESGVNLVVGAVQELFKGIKEAADAFPGPNPLGNAMQSAIDKMNGVTLGRIPDVKATSEGLGVAVIDGVIAGMSYRESVLAAAVETVASGIPARFRRVVEAASPSKVMMRIGSDIIQGLAIGVHDATPFVDEQIANLRDAFTHEFDPNDPEQVGQFHDWGKQVAANLLTSFNNEFDANDPESVAQFKGWIDTLKVMAEGLGIDVSADLQVVVDAVKVRGGDIAQALADGFGAHTDWFTNQLKDAFDSMAADVHAGGVNVMAHVDWFNGQWRDAFDNMAADVKDKVPLIMDRMEWFDGQMQDAFDNIAADFAVGGSTATSHLTWFTNQVTDAFDGLIDSATDPAIIAAFKQLRDGILAQWTQMATDAAGAAAPIQSATKAIAPTQLPRYGSGPVDAFGQPIVAPTLTRTAAVLAPMTWFQVMGGSSTFATHTAKALGEGINTLYFEPMTKVIADLNAKYKTAAAFATGAGYDVYGASSAFYAKPLETALRAHGALFDKGGWLMPGLTLALNKTGVPERVIAPGRGGEVSITMNFYGLDPIADPIARRKVAIAVRDEMLRVS